MRQNHRGACGHVRPYCFAISCLCLLTCCQPFMLLPVPSRLLLVPVSCSLCLSSYCLCLCPSCCHCLSSCCHCLSSCWLCLLAAAFAFQAGPFVSGTLEEMVYARQIYKQQAANTAIGMQAHTAPHRHATLVLQLPYLAQNYATSLVNNICDVLYFCMVRSLRSILQQTQAHSLLVHSAH